MNTQTQKETQTTQTQTQTQTCNEREVRDRSGLLLTEGWFRLGLDLNNQSINYSYHMLCLLIYLNL